MLQYACQQKHESLLNVLVIIIHNMFAPVCNIQHLTATVKMCGIL